MRITHVIASLDPAQGGPPVVAERLAAAQAQLGHTVALASEVACGDSITLPHHRLVDLFRGTKPEVTALIQRSDILHLHGVWEPLLVAVATAARHHAVPYFIAPHGMLDPWSLAQKKWKKKLALTMGYRRMLNGAAALHLLNEDEKRLLAPLGLTVPGAVIPNGIFLDEIEPPPDATAFRASANGPGERPYLLFLSRLHYKKGLDYLADAFAELAPQFPELLLVVAGPDGGEEAPFRSRIAALGLSDRVRLPGPLYGAMKWSAIAGADCFVLPSRQEGFSMAILEALACRVPVVVSENCHFPEVADVGAGAVVPIAGSAKAIAAILRDPLLSARMGAAGRKLVEERFTWPQVAARSLEVYRRLARPAQPK